MLLTEAIKKRPRISKKIEVRYFMFTLFLFIKPMGWFEYGALPKAKNEAFYQQACLVSDGGCKTSNMIALYVDLCFDSKFQIDN